MLPPLDLRLLCDFVFRAPYGLQVVKNHFASEFIYNKYKHMKTCDIIEVDMIDKAKNVIRILVQRYSL